VHGVHAVFILSARHRYRRRKSKILKAGLPDGLFSNQKFQFG
jgi:hypothetical protein